MLAAVACGHPGGALAGATRTRACALTPAESLLARGAALYPACAVEQRAEPLSPEMARVNYHLSPGREACLTARVMFVVGADGIPEPGSGRVVSTNDFGFAQAVLNSMAGWRYRPATIRGLPVRQVVTEARTVWSQVVRVPAGSGPPMTSRSGPPC
jgi:hypothetical protein